MAAWVAAGLGSTGCKPCGPDENEPNDAEEDAAPGGDVTSDLNEIDLDFHDLTDVDCFTYEIAAPTSSDVPILYVELKGTDRETFDASLSFACDGGAASAFSCNGEDVDEPSCRTSGEQTRFRITYDCDDASDAIGAASFIVCVGRSDPGEICSDYSIRTYLN